MGLLTCSRCRAKTTADSIEEGRKMLDHSIGLVLGKPCQDGLVELIFTGPEKPKKPITKKTTSKTKKYIKP